MQWELIVCRLKLEIKCVLKMQRHAWHWYKSTDIIKLKCAIIWKINPYKAHPLPEDDEINLVSPEMGL